MNHSVGQQLERLEVEKLVESIMMILLQPDMAGNLESVKEKLLLDGCYCHYRGAKVSWKRVNDDSFCNRFRRKTKNSN